MTLKELRSKCLMQTGNLSPTVLLPDLNNAVRSAVRDCVRYLGGMPRDTEITTVSGTREYGTDAGFPEDYMADEGVHDDSNDNWLKRGSFKESLFSSTGTPSEYYIRGRVIGFEREPDSAITLTLYYKGFGDDVTSDSADILSEFSFADDDSLWEAITHQFAYEFWSRKLSEASTKMDTTGMQVAQGEMVRHEQRALEMKHKAKVQILENNQNEAGQVDLPADYFSQSKAFIKLDHGRVLRRR